ncbi:MAG: YebC/PmpR family DNA-binding transcriptional regulator, partial [Planctomycetaceae bacterium]|nr:YebC/PmpR family DNA-binding transcriptional regulator [Planctomycetaceae bacterium]
RKGLFLVPAEGNEEETLFEIAVEAGAEDVRQSGDSFEILCDPEAFDSVNASLEEQGIETTMAEITRVASNTVELDANDGMKVLKLIEALEDQDDIQNVTANFNISDEIMEELAASM